MYKPTKEQILTINAMLFTENARSIFERLLDKNFEAKKETDVVKQLEFLIEVNALKKELRTEMGDEAYYSFMEQGSKMFAPANS